MTDDPLQKVSMSKKMSMSVDGEGLTRIARDFCLSDMPSRAWRLLVNGLHGPVGPETIAADVLDGKLKLVGNSSSKRGLRTARDNDVSYRKSMQYIFAGRVRIDGSWWRPSAEVLDFGEEDAHFAFHRVRDEESLDSIADGARLLLNVTRHRVAYYAREGERVVFLRVKNSKRNRVVIFEPVAERPFWWQEHPTVVAAFEEFIACGRRLQSRGRVEPRTEATPVVQGPEPKTEEDYKTEEEQFERAVHDIRERVLAQAAGDMISLRLENGEVLAVPRAPFEHWALSRSPQLKHLAAPWTPVAPSGMKLPLDDPFHTDWLLGAGRSLEEAYRGPVHDASISWLIDVQRRFGNFDCAVLVPGEEVIGTIGEDILVLPNLDPKYVTKLGGARAIITQAGGALAHLAQVALERNVPIVLVEDALTRYLPGQQVRVCTDSGRIHVVGMKKKE